jgi:hypothetical protein
MVTEKKAFVGKLKGQPEERQAIALEFIAHYLDRIDSHLNDSQKHSRAGRGTRKFGFN